MKRKIKKWPNLNSFKKGDVFLMNNEKHLIIDEGSIEFESEEVQQQVQQVVNTKIYIGIDNGVSGTVGWSGICQNGQHTFGQTKKPTFSEQSYTKAKGNIARLNFKEYMIIVGKIKSLSENCIALVERPMVNPGRFKASTSALRCLEAELIALEMMEIPIQYIDSKQWQKEMLPKGIKGAPELKKASIDIGKRMFPSLKCKPDADGILIAEWARRKGL